MRQYNMRLVEWVIFEKCILVAIYYKKTKY